MNSADILRQMENLKRAQMNNNTRIAQEQRSVDNYERQANEYKRQANESPGGGYVAAGGAIQAAHRRFAKEKS